DRAEVGQDVFDLFTIIESKPTHDLIGNLLASEHVFKLTALRIGTIENREVLVGTVLVACEPLDLRNNKFGFPTFIGELRANDRKPFFVISPKGFVLTRLVVADDLTGGRDDRLGRAVILLELHDFGAWIISLEIQNVMDISASPFVDG